MVVIDITDNIIFIVQNILSNKFFKTFLNPYLLNVNFQNEIRLEKLQNHEYYQYFETWWGAYSYETSFVSSWYLDPIYRDIEFRRAAPYCSVLDNQWLHVVTDVSYILSWKCVRLVAIGKKNDDSLFIIDQRAGAALEAGQCDREIAIAKR